SGNNNPPAGNPPPPPAGNNAANSGSSTAADTQPPLISNVQDNGPVYYGNNTCGNTTLTLTATVSDNASGVQRVYVRYNLRTYNPINGTNFKEKDMTPIGGGLYRLTLDMNAEAAAFLNGLNGGFEYQIMASDGKNNWQTYPDTNQPGGGHPAAITINYCGSNPPPGGVPGPPQPPASQPLTISNVQVNPADVYYGVCVSGEATALQVQATIDPLDQIQSARVRYGFVPDPTMLPQQETTVNMYPLGIGDYAADIDVAAAFAGQSMGDGYLTVVVEATDKQGHTVISNATSARLHECTLTILPSPPSINYFYSLNNNEVMEGSAILFTWDTENATCGVTLNGDSVPEDAVEYSAGTAMFGLAGTQLTFTLEARGGDCSNPDSVQQAVTITIVAPTTDGTATIYNAGDYDMDGGGADLSFDYYSGDEGSLLGLGGTLLAVWYGGTPSVTQCRSYVDNSSYASVTIIEGDWVCFKTGNGHYGYLVISTLVPDQSNPIQSYINIYYETEYTP
ncbi:MAG: hypothetical protein D6803_08435, partial [Anaerolineae bacterium]